MQELRYLVFLLEGLAAVSALYYYKKKPANKSAGFFAYFLLTVYFVETIAWIPTVIYRWENLHFLKNSFWYQNYWIHNPFLIISFLAYGYYFKIQLLNFKARKFINIGLIVYLLGCSTNLVLSKVYLKSFSVLSYVAGSLMLLGIIFYYYLEILQSQKILIIKKELGFYISVVSFIYYLSCTPIFIYYKYFNSLSPGFVELSTWVLVSMNIFMYSTYTFAFVWLANKTKPSTKNLKNGI